jgi:hypothetical protein
MRRAQTRQVTVAVMADNGEILEVPTQFIRMIVPFHVFVGAVDEEKRDVFVSDVSRPRVSLDTK